MSLLPEAYGELEGILREKRDIQQQLQALMDRVAVSF